MATRLFVSTRYKTALICIYVLAFLTALTFVSLIGVSHILDYLFGDPSLTGRDEIWAYAFQKYDSSPWGGIGYGALWQVGWGLWDALRNQGYTFLIVNEAHNGYVDILAQLGRIGLLFLIFFLLASLVRIYRYANSKDGRRKIGLADYAIYLFWGAIIYNMTESSFFDSCNLWFVLVFVLAAATGRLAPRLRSGDLPPKFYPAAIRVAEAVGSSPKVGPVRRVI